MPPGWRSTTLAPAVVLRLLLIRLRGLGLGVLLGVLAVLTVLAVLLGVVALRVPAGPTALWPLRGFLRSLALILALLVLLLGLALLALWLGLGLVLGLLTLLPLLALPVLVWVLVLT